MGNYHVQFLGRNRTAMPVTCPVDVTKEKYMKKHYLRHPYSILSAMLYLIVFIGISLAIYQFIFNRSLWLDEAKLALNIINKDFIGLTKPLDYHQVAPIGFLFIEKISVLILGKNELALRIFPLISFLTSIPFFYLLSNKLVKNNVIALISTSIFSITLSLLRYSSEVKQYSTDVLFTIIILYYSLTLQLNKNKSLFIYAIIGSIAVCFSNISIIILFVTGVYLLYFDGYKNKNYKVLFPFLFWATAFFIYYYLLIHNNPTTESMKTSWENAFLPLNPFSKDFYSFLLFAVKSIYAKLLHFDYFWIIPFIISLSAIGIMLKQRKYTLLYFCLTPIIVHLLLSGLALYPFSKRLILYTAPLIILIFSFGLYHLFEFFNKKILRLPNLLLILPVVIFFYPIYLKFPITKQEIKNSLNYIEQNLKKEDEIYVYYASEYAFKFYKETKIININNKIIVGTKHKENHHNYDHELLNLKGKVWLLFSHVYPPRENYDNEEKYMIAFLISKGSVLLDVKKYKGSSVYYVDTKRQHPIKNLITLD
jgi:hypothetical protein